MKTFANFKNMSKFAETYADYCGVKLPKDPPEFPSVYFPIPEKYITLQSGSGMGEARNYSWYNEVTNMLDPILKKHGIQIVQIGGPKENLIHSCIDYRGQTSLRQATFIVDNALLHLGNDSFFAHYAGVKKIPLVAVYGTTQSAVTGPFYHGECKLIDSHRKGKKAAHQVDEEPKTVDYINPEVVAQAVLDLLKIDFKIPLQTIYIGNRYRINNVIDFIPDFPLPAKMFDSDKITCRMDLNYNLQAFAQAAALYKVAVLTNKAIPVQVLEKFKDNIVIIRVDLDNNIDSSWLNYLKTSGISYQLTSKKDGRDLNDLKLKFFDFNPIFRDKRCEINPEIPKLKPEYLVRSKRSFLSNGQFFPSEYHWKMNRPFNKLIPFSVGDAVDSLEFLESIEFYHIFEKTS